MPQPQIANSFEMNQGLRRAKYKVEMPIQPKNLGPTNVAFAKIGQNIAHTFGVANTFSNVLYFLDPAATVEVSLAGRHSTQSIAFKDSCVAGKSAPGPIETRLSAVFGDPDIAVVLRTFFEMLLLTPVAKFRPAASSR